MEISMTFVNSGLILFAMLLASRALRLTDKAQQIHANWIAIRDQALDLRTESDMIIDNARRIVASVRVHGKLSPEELRVLQSLEAVMLARSERR